MLKINKCFAFLLTLSLSGCSLISQNDSMALQAGDYAAILPFESSDTRVKHVGLISDQDLRIEVESGLMDLSKQYFSPDDVGYKTHVFLDFDVLDATDGSRGLLGTLRDDNPNGLNPRSDAEFDTGNGLVTQAVILVDIYELDWYKNDSLRGISLALVVNDALDSGDETVEITDEKLINYIEVTASNLVNYMRQRFNEVSSNIPIYIATYRLDSTGNSYGGYMYQGYFDGTNQDYSELDEDWLLMPSTDFSTFDSTVADEFSTFTADLNNVLADYTYVTGEAKVENGNIVKMNIEVDAHGKTAGEILAVTQTANSSLSVFTSTDCTYMITVKNDDTVYAMISRDIDSTATTVISTF